MRAAATLEKVVSALDRCGVPVLPVKGVLTARTLYPYLADRMMSDIDVRVVPEHLPLVVEAAREAGWPLKTRRAYRSVDLMVGGFGVEFETWVGNPYMSRLTVADMVGRATRSTEVFGFPVLVPEFHDHLLLQCLNIYKDHLVDAVDWAVEDLIQSVDHPSFDAARLCRVAAEAGNTTMLYVVARWLAESRGCRGWDAVRQRIGSPPRTRYAALMLAWTRRGWRHPTYLGALLGRGTSDHRVDRAKAIAAMADFAITQRGLRPQ